MIKKSSKKGMRIPKGHPAYNLPDSTGPGSIEGQPLGLSPQQPPGMPMGSPQYNQDGQGM